MKYELKPGVESFEVVDGPHAGSKYVKGREYEEIPSSEKNKFQPVKEVKPIQKGSKAAEKATKEKGD